MKIDELKTRRNVRGDHVRSVGLDVSELLDPEQEGPRGQLDSVHCGTGGRTYLALELESEGSTSKSSQLAGSNPERRATEKTYCRVGPE